VAGTRDQVAALYDPLAVVQPRCPRTVLAGPVRLSSGKGPTVSRTSAIRRRVRRRPGKVAGLGSVIRRAIGRSRKFGDSIRITDGLTGGCARKFRGAGNHAISGGCGQRKNRSGNGRPIRMPLPRRAAQRWPGRVSSSPGTRMS